MRRHPKARWGAALLLLALPLVATGCARGSLAALRPPPGLIITYYKAPLSLNFDRTPVCSKYGEASSFYIRDVFFTGLEMAFEDCDIKRAADNGRLTKVHYADYELLQILGLFAMTRVRAYGE